MNTELATKEMTDKEWVAYQDYCNMIEHHEDKMLIHGNELLDAIVAVQEQELWRGEHSSFNEFMNAKVGRTRAWLSQQKKRLGVLNNLTPETNIGVNAALSLSELPDEEQADAWAESQEKAESEGRETPTTKDVKETVQKRKNAKGGEYKPPETPKDDKPPLVGPDPKEFHKCYGQMVRFLKSLDKHHRTTAFYQDLQEGYLDPLLKKYNETVKEFA